MVEHTMDVSGWLRKQLEEASPDLLRAMIKEMAEALMSADADVVCGAGYGENNLNRLVHHERDATRTEIQLRQTPAGVVAVTCAGELFHQTPRTRRGGCRLRATRSSPSS